MIRFPNCKINLGLRITRKRADGFHDLETVFYPVELKDALEMIPDAKADASSLQVTGRTVDGDAASNLCIKAWHLLKNDFPELVPVRMHLHKRIPMGAGLGGGSADGAFALKMLNDRFRLGLSDERLAEYAFALGSDCPFFIYNKPCMAGGRGEQLTQIDLDLQDYRIVLVWPGIHVNTGWAFSQVQPLPSGKPIETIIRQPVGTWRDELVNDFEAPVFRNHPALAGIRENLYAQGAVYAAMSGSGSTIFGIFPADADMEAVREMKDLVFISGQPK